MSLLEFYMELTSIETNTRLQYKNLTNYITFFVNTIAPHARAEGRCALRNAFIYSKNT